MLVVSVCEHFGWTYDEYMSQPQFFLDLVREKLIRDNKERELRANQMKRGI